MSDGPTAVEKARERLERAAVAYSRAGRRPASPENRDALTRATQRLERAALNYGWLMAPPQWKRGRQVGQSCANNIGRSTMSYECPRCGTSLVEVEDDVNDYELEGKQVRHTVKRCADVEGQRAHDDGRLLKATPIRR